MKYGFLLDYERIREDFPIYRHNPKIVYLDNAATTHKPRQVIEVIKNFYEMLNANPLRGVYDLARRATEAYIEAHEIIAKFINAKDWREVIFVRNTTEAINVIAYSLASLLREGDNIVTTIMEHHSNLLPWVKIARLKGVELRVAPVKPNGELDIEKLLSLIDDRTKVVALTHVSNVLGVMNDVRRVAREAHRFGALVLVDAAQSVPHTKVDVRLLEVDFLVFSGHKMLGPMGIGVLWGRWDVLEMLDSPFLGGGTVKSVKVTDGGVIYELHELPWRFEPGTPDVASALGLVEAIRYLEKLGLERVEAHERTLTRLLLKRFEEELGDSVKIMGSIPVEKRIGIVAFMFKDMEPLKVAEMLGMQGIAVRAGFHCAEPLHKVLGFEKGSVRASFYIYNGPDDVEALIEGLKRLRTREQ